MDGPVDVYGMRLTPGPFDLRSTRPAESSVVEVLKRYTNKTCVLADLRRAMERLGAPFAELAPDQGPTDLASASKVQGGRLLTSRFTSEELTGMVERFQAGATLSQVATEYRIGLTTIKRLVRQRRARRRDQS
jgi:hypothetical protein